MATSIFEDGIIEGIISKAQFIIADKRIESSKEPVYESYEDMQLSPLGMEFWRKTGYPTMWRHQKVAIEKAMEGKNICISTSTSSGKTEIFQTIAIEKLSEKKGQKILAVYSAKALNRQQRSRWEKTGFKVGQIDGDNTNFKERCDKLQNCDIIVMTPDVLHAFLLANIHSKDYGNIIRNFIKNISLIIIDEIHLYRGVFGTNSAYLFRRLNNIRRILRKDKSYPQFITASATLSNPAQHSELITGGTPFENIGIEIDGSPMAERTFYFLKSGNTKDGLSLPAMTARLATEISKFEDARSITFVTGRQQTGDLTLRGEEILDDIDVEKTRLYPFRAGVESETREKILEAMEKKEFNGIISTSALEIGIDIAGLNVCILANIPYDRNSYYQRIGRVGRGGSANKSVIIIINDESLNGNLIFDSFNYDIDKVLPDLEPALHLESDNVMYAHAACHVHSSKENCEISEKDVNEVMKKYFPEAFYKLCLQIVSGNRPADYDVFAARSDNPHKALSLRNMHMSYQVVEDDNIVKGDVLTSVQLFREGYQYAIRSTSKWNPFMGKIETYLQKVLYIDKADRIVKTTKIRNKQNIRTQSYFRTSVNPNLSKSGFLHGFKLGRLSLLNVKLYENKVAHGYYLINNGEKPEYREYDVKFKDEIATTGIVLFFPPLFDEPQINIEAISCMIFEAFLLQKAFDRNDISYQHGALKAPSDSFNLNAGEKFIALYDINQLNITKNLIDISILKRTFQFLLDNISYFSATLFEEPINLITRDVVVELCLDVLHNDPTPLDGGNLDETISIFDNMSPAVWHKQITPDSEIEKIPCKVLAVEKNANENLKVKYTVLTANNGVEKVEMDNLYPDENSFFRKYNWEKGV